MVEALHPSELREAIRVLSTWQQDDITIQLHPGDLGWYERFGGQTLSKAIRIWKSNGQINAIGLLDGTDLLRLAIAPGSRNDTALAQDLTLDIVNPSRGVLPKGSVSVEARGADILNRNLIEHGFELGDSWTPLRRDLSVLVEDSVLRIETIGSDKAKLRCAIQRSAFAGSTFREDKWINMSKGPAYKNARCLVGFDENNNAVGAATVWSAGKDKPGLIEPLGVDSKYRNKGYGKSMALACAMALQEMDAASATVATESSNLTAVATYKSAGFYDLGEVRDLHRRE